MGPGRSMPPSTSAACGNETSTYQSSIHPDKTHTGSVRQKREQSPQRDGGGIGDCQGIRAPQLTSLPGFSGILPAAEQQVGSMVETPPQAAMPRRVT